MNCTFYSFCGDFRHKFIPHVKKAGEALLGSKYGHNRPAAFRVAMANVYNASTSVGKIQQFCNVQADGQSSTRTAMSQLSLLGRYNCKRRLN
jgi:hypothetical protein